MIDAPTPFEAMNQALEVLGSKAELARVCKVSPTAVWKWVQSSKRLPAEYVLRVEAATGISRHVLRPDIYPVEVPGHPDAFVGVDLGQHRVSFQNGRISQSQHRAQHQADAA